MRLKLSNSLKNYSLSSTESDLLYFIIVFTDKIRFVLSFELLSRFELRFKRLVLNLFFVRFFRVSCTLFSRFHLPFKKTREFSQKVLEYSQYLIKKYFVLGNITRKFNSIQHKNLFFTFNFFKFFKPNFKIRKSHKRTKTNLVTF